MSELCFVDACTDGHFKAMSLIHALGWRDSYVGYVPDAYMALEITDDHWVVPFRAGYESGSFRGLLLCRDEEPVAALSYGPARNQEPGCEGWGEIYSFYVHPAHRGRGYGGVLFEEAVSRLSTMGHSDAYVYVLKENEGARRFYATHGFTWDGTTTHIPFPPDAVCEDLRYGKKLWQNRTAHQ